MSVTEGDRALEWDLVDRLHKSMRVAHLTGPGIAAKLDVHRNTVNNYLSGRTKPDRRTLVAWAFATGVPVEWLITGQGEPHQPEGGGVRVELPRLDSNQQPSDYRHITSSVDTTSTDDYTLSAVA